MKWTTRLAFGIFPQYVWSTLIIESRLTWGRWANAVLPGRRQGIRRLRERRHTRLHLGCGGRIVPGWINVDGMAVPGRAMQWDLRYPLPLRGNSAQAVYSEHFVEHLFRDDAVNMFKDCYRVLEPGGVLRLGVPDAELYLRAYAEGQADFFAGLWDLGGGAVVLHTPIDVINQMFRMGGNHLFAWDYDTLARELRTIGFVEVARWAAEQASSAELCLDDPVHAFETLYVEATKPRLQPALR